MLGFSSQVSDNVFSRKSKLFAKGAITPTEKVSRTTRFKVNR